MTTIIHGWREHHWVWQETIHAEGVRVTSYLCECGKTKQKVTELKKRTQNPQNRVSRVRQVKSPQNAKDAPATSRMRKTRLKAQSHKRSAENRKYLDLRRQFLKDNPICQFKDCLEWSTQCHHKRGREGPWLTDITEFMACCATHHTWIEDNREEAAAMGYLKLRLTTDQLNQTTP